MSDITEKLALLANTKDAIKNAIDAKGQVVGDIPFSQYPAKIAAIETDTGSDVAMTVAGAEISDWGGIYTELVENQKTLQNDGDMCAVWSNEGASNLPYPEDVPFSGYAILCSGVVNVLVYMSGNGFKKMFFGSMAATDSNITWQEVIMGSKGYPNALTISNFNNPGEAVEELQSGQIAPFYAPGGTGFPPGISSMFGYVQRNRANGAYEYFGYTYTSEGGSRIFIGHSPGSAVTWKEIPTDSTTYTVREVLYGSQAYEWIFTLGKATLSPNGEMVVYPVACTYYTGNSGTYLNATSYVANMTQVTLSSFISGWNGIKTKYAAGESVMPSVVQFLNNFFLPLKSRGSEWMWSGDTSLANGSARTFTMPTNYVWQSGDKFQIEYAYLGGGSEGHMMGFSNGATVIYNPNETLTTSFFTLVTSGGNASQYEIQFVISYNKATRVLSIKATNLITGSANPAAMFRIKGIRLLRIS